MTDAQTAVTYSCAFTPDEDSEISVVRQRRAWAEDLRDYFAGLGLQPVFCRTGRRADGKISPFPMDDTTGRAEFGAFVLPEKGFTRPAFRPPAGAFLLDVDQKADGADGVVSLARAEDDLGPLPDTQRLSARGADQDSGRLCFRIPSWLVVDEKFFGQYGGAIDVVRTGHRFSMAVGDVHHELGTVVHCYDPDGTPADLLPVDQWPMLPPDWVLALDEWNEARGTAFDASGLTGDEDDPEDEDSNAGLDRIMPPHQARSMVVSQFDKILTHEVAGSGFRNKLMSASLTLGGFVGSLYPDAQDCVDALAAAVGKVWGAEADSDDMSMILSGVAKGAVRPWIVLGEDEPESPAAAATTSVKLPPVTLSDVPQAVTWLRSEIGRNGLSGLFLRAGQLVKVVEAPLLPDVDASTGVIQHDGFQQIARIDKPNQLRSYAQMSGYRFYTKGSKQTPPKPILLNSEAAGVCIDTPEGLPFAQTLKGVTGTPVIRADGTILDVPGYDVASQLLYKPDSATLTVPWVADQPSADEVEAARSVLEYLVIDYKFVDDNHRANYLGALMLPLLRALVPPPYKLLAIDAYAPGSGKTLLADVLRIVHHGRRGGTPGGSFRSEWPKSEEFSKWVTSVLMNGAGGVVQVDNVKATLAGGELEGLLTNDSYGGRVLGRSEEVHVPNDRLWTVTGNNISIGGDMARRVLWVRIDPGEENPEQRSPDSFHEPRLADWAFENRGRIIHAVLTVARAWYVAGAAMAPATSSDSYARAISVVQGILKFAGITGTFDAVEERAASQDEDDIAGFLQGVWCWQDGREESTWTSAQLTQVINSDAFPPDDDEEGEPLHDLVPEYWWGGKMVMNPRRLGERLNKAKGSWHRGKMLARGPVNRTNTATWTIKSR